MVSYIADLDKIKAKGVDEVVIVASNDAFVMSAWGKANGVLDDSIVSASPGPVRAVGPGADSSAVVRE